MPDATTAPTAESIDVMLIESVARTKPKVVKAPNGRSSSFVQPRAWTMGGEVD